MVETDVVLASVVEGVPDAVRVLDGVVEVPDGVVDGAVEGEVVVMFSVKRTKKANFYSYSW